MITKTIRDILRGDAAIRNRVQDAKYTRVFAGNAPADAKGETIIVRDVTGNHQYSLAGETDTRESIVQVDCYSNSAGRAYSLFELVRMRISGNPGHADIKECTITGGFGADEEAPRDNSDHWIHRYSKDFTIFHTESVPTLTD